MIKTVLIESFDMYSLHEKINYSLENYRKDGWNFYSVQYSREEGIFTAYVCFKRRVFNGK